MTDKQQHWENVYREKSIADVSWFQAEPSLSLNKIQACGLDQNDAIIDVGGGASRLVDVLLDHGYRNVAVLDISATAIVHSQHRLGQRADQVEWFIEDITRFKSPRKFHLWHDRAVFHFLTNPDDRRRYLEVLRQTLEPGGDVIIATFAVGGPEKCSGLDIVQYDEEKISAVLGDAFKLVDVGHEIHLTPQKDEQAFSYFHFRKIK